MHSTNIYYTIYETTNLINGKKYRGAHKTNNPYDDYFGSGLLIKASIKKHGKHNFKKDILFFAFTEVDMYIAEEIFVDSSWVLSDHTYNMCLGGGVPTDIKMRKKASETRIKNNKNNLEKGMTPRLAKSYILTTPFGTWTITSGLRNFIKDLPKELNVTYGALRNLLYSNSTPMMGSYVGWTLTYIDGKTTAKSKTKDFSGAKIFNKDGSSWEIKTSLSHTVKEIMLTHEVTYPSIKCLWYRYKNNKTETKGDWYISY